MKRSRDDEELVSLVRRSEQPCIACTDASVLKMADTALISRWHEGMDAEVLLSDDAALATCCGRAVVVESYRLRQLVEECAHDCSARMQIASSAAEDALQTEGASVFRLAGSLLEECEVAGLGCRHAARLALEAVFSCHLPDHAIKPAAAAVHETALDARGDEGASVSRILDALDLAGVSECALNALCVLAFLEVISEAALTKWSIAADEDARGRLQPLLQWIQREEEEEEAATVDVEAMKAPEGDARCLQCVEGKGDANGAAAPSEQEDLCRAVRTHASDWEPARAKPVYAAIPTPHSSAGWIPSRRAESTD